MPEERVSVGGLWGIRKLISDKLRGYGWHVLEAAGTNIPDLTSEKQSS